MSAEPDGVGVAARVRRLEQAVIDAGLTSDEELDSVLEGFLARAKPINGARLIARAWNDEEFRRHLLGDAGSAIEEMGLPSLSVLRVVENTEVVHNVVVCTLCSC